MNRLTDMYDSNLIPQMVEHMHTEIVKEQDKYILRRLMELDIDKDILINQTAEIRRLNEIIQKDNELEEQGLLLRLPCKMGDTVWTIRNYRGIKHPQKGVVDSMFFTKDMRLLIVVKHIARGEWGKEVFSTKEEAEKALAERSGKQ